jgi:DNA-binding CsgD family transcriptional regulator
MKRDDLRKASSEGRYALRKREIAMVHSGMQKGEVAILLGVNKNTVSN